MQTKEELLEIEQRLLVEMGRRYGAHLEKAAAARRARSRERARRARISIHAPREGSDAVRMSMGAVMSRFQSTLPVRGATVRTRGCADGG